MSDSCLIEQPICPLYTGDTFPFEFVFVQPDGSPLNISNMTIVLYLYIYGEEAFPKDEDIPPAPGTRFFSNGEAMKKVELFPEDQNSIDGLGFMTLLPEETSQLLPGNKYNYKFKLENSTAEIFTVGVGQINVK